VNLFLLYAEFFKTGLFAVGGGLATLPFLYDMANRYEWLSPEKIGDLQAMAQSSPGAIGSNLAALVGFEAAGIPGAYVAPLGLMSPSIIIIVIVAGMLQAFKENALVKAVFSALRPAAGGLLSAAALGALKTALYRPGGEGWTGLLRWKECLLFGALFFLIFRFKKHPVIYIAAAGACGVLLKF
jgi:chromate transporter